MLNLNWKYIWRKLSTATCVESNTPYLIFILDLRHFASFYASDKPLSQNLADQFSLTWLVQSFQLEEMKIWSYYSWEVQVYHEVLY